MILDQCVSRWGEAAKRHLGSLVPSPCPVPPLHTVSPAASPADYVLSSQCWRYEFSFRERGYSPVLQ